MFDTCWQVTVKRSEKPLVTVYDFTTREEAQFYADAEIEESVVESVEAIEICSSCRRKFGHGHANDCETAKSVDEARRPHVGHDTWPLDGDPIAEQNQIYNEITT